MVIAAYAGNGGPDQTESINAKEYVNIEVVSRLT